MSLPCLPDGPPISVPLLVEVLELCRETWIRDFLFKMEPTADVGILTSPGQLERATVLDEISSAFETTGQYCSMFDVISISRWLVVPVFNVGPVSAEIIMMPKESKSNPFFKVRGIQTIIRMVRNNRTGDSLVSFDNRKDDVLTLWLFKRETKLRRRRICLVGKREFFLQSLLSPTGIDFEKIIKSLTMYFESREVYCCPMCSYATSGAHCTCPKDFKRPSHPLDFTHARENLLNHCGRFTGSSTVNLPNIESPFQFTRGAMASVMDIKPCMDLGLIPAIVDMSIKNKMSENCVVPPVMSSPAVAEDAGVSFADPAIISSTHNSTYGTSLLAHVDGSGSFPINGVLNAGNTSNNLQLTASDTQIGTNGADVVVDAREVAERKRNRKLRNREAAQRSNLKRKERYETLIENVSAIRRTKAELLEREKELKNENESLRMLLNKDNTLLTDL